MKRVGNNMAAKVNYNVDVYYSMSVVYAGSLRSLSPRLIVSTLNQTYNSIFSVSVFLSMSVKLECRWVMPAGSCTV